LHLLIAVTECEHFLGRAIDLMSFNNPANNVHAPINSSTKEIVSDYYNWLKDSGIEMPDLERLKLAIQLTSISSLSASLAELQDSKIEVSGFIDLCLLNDTGACTDTLKISLVDQD